MKPRSVHDKIPESTRPRDILRRKEASEFDIVRDPRKINRDKRYTIWERRGKDWLLDRSYYGVYFTPGTEGEYFIKSKKHAVVPEGVNPNPEDHWSRRAVKESYDRLLKVFNQAEVRAVFDRFIREFE
jgi:hypothetical protein